MKGIKKLLSIIVAGASLFSLTPCAMARDFTVNIPGWDLSMKRYDADNLEEDYVNVKVLTNNSMVYGGEACLYIKGGDVYRENTLAKAGQVLKGFNIGSTYKLTAKMYSSNGAGTQNFRIGNQDLVNADYFVNNQQLVPGRWCDVEYVFENTSVETTFFAMNWGTGDYYLDDICLQEVFLDDAGEVTGYGENLVVNGDFEQDLDYTPCGEVQNINVINMDSRSKISWENPDDYDFVKVAIYKVVNGQETLLKTAKETSVDVTGLENGKTYTYRLKTIDEWDNYSDGVDVNVTPIVDEVKNTEIKFKKGESVIQHIEQGTLTASVKYQNNRMAEDYSVELILALLKDGVMVDLNSTYEIIPIGKDETEYTEVEVSIEVPEGDGYKAELYIWDSLTGMEALKDVITIE